MSRLKTPLNQIKDYRSHCGAMADYKMSKDLEKNRYLVDELGLCLASVDDEDSLEELSKQIQGVYEESDIKEMDYFMMRELANHICFKLYQVKEDKLRPNMFSLYEYLRKNQYVSSMLEKSIDDKFKISREPQSVNKKATKVNRVIPVDSANGMQQTIMNLKKLLNTSTKSNSIDKNLGFCLLDLEGNFLFLCKKSRHFFGIKNTETKICNFFELLIPFSKQMLAQKFGSEMFHANRANNSSCNFTYVIYSKTALKKFYNIMKSKKLETRDQLEDKLNSIESSENNGRDLYHAYLTSLTSCATIITIKYTDRDISEFSEQKNLFRKNLKLFELDFLTREFVNPNFYDKGDPSTPGEKFGGGNFKDIPGYPKTLSDRMEDSHFSNSGFFVYTKQVILLKTRFSKHATSFNYHDLKDQPQIVAFRQYLTSKIFGSDEKVDDDSADEKAEEKMEVEE